MMLRMSILLSVWYLAVRVRLKLVVKSLALRLQFVLFPAIDLIEVRVCWFHVSRNIHETVLDYAKLDLTREHLTRSSKKTPGL